MTVADLRTDLYADLGFGASPPAETAARLLRHLNKGQRAILREPGLSRLRDTIAPIPFASVASQSIYGLPSNLERITAITERDTDRDLAPISLIDLRAIDPALRASGTPDRFVPLGYRPIKTQPASTGLWIVSSSASDTTQVVRVLGVRASGEPVGPFTATITGITRVAIGSTITDFADVVEFSISVVGVGVISLYDAASSGNEIAQIPIGRQSSQYFSIQLYPTPTGATTYYVDGTLKIPDLVSDQDVPLLPEAFHDLLNAYARMREYEPKGDSERLVIATQEYRLGLSRLKHAVNSQAVEIHQLGARPSRHQSRYGAWAQVQPWE